MLCCLQPLTELGAKIRRPGFTGQLSVAARILLVGSALLMPALTNFPLPSLGLLFLTGTAAVWPDALSISGCKRTWNLTSLAWLATAALPLSLTAASAPISWLQNDYAVSAWLLAAAYALASKQAMHPGSSGLLALTWAWLGMFIWLVRTYIQNQALGFWVGLGGSVALLILCKCRLRLPRFAILAVNTLILFLVLTPLADLLIRPKFHEDSQPDVAGRDYLYETAEQKPAAFKQYWARYLGQYKRLMKEMTLPDLTRALPYRVRTNIYVNFFKSRIHINSRGFRGREVSKEKGKAYRIVALGESNTFGFTINPEHKPWPRLLEELIQQRMRLRRPVEVINTGLPNHNLKDNIRRLLTDILPLKPDMIISYHGWNGFPWLYPSLPAVFVKHLPHYRQRPLWILAECEYRLRLIAFKHSLQAEPVQSWPSQAELLNTRFGKAYQSLEVIAHTNGIRLVLANYSMAVNGASDSKIVEFYRQAFPAVYPSIQVNALHSGLLQYVIRQNPETVFVDTQPGLDGEHQKFIDLVHFAPEGDRQMAETFFAALTNVLASELAKPD